MHIFADQSIYVLQMQNLIFVYMSFTDFADRLAWGINRFKNSFAYAFSCCFQLFIPVKKGRVVCWAYHFRQYSCNPRYISEYLLDHCPEYEIIWVFRKHFDTTAVDSRIKCITLRSWDYYKYINSAEFVFTNARADSMRFQWRKRKGQKYIQTWHGGVAMKRVEADACEALSFQYISSAKNDSAKCDLMISGAKVQTKLLSGKFWYDGPILECGTPRCDIFFKKELHKKIKEKVFKLYGLKDDAKVVLYAPTFRSNQSLEPYRINWEPVMVAFRKMLGSDDLKIFFRLHSKIASKDTSSLINVPDILDVTKYPDMQELLCVADVLVTDYSSSMFDFPLLGKPCLLYACDADEYDRGFYYKFEELPFPFARTQEELAGNIDSFNEDVYAEKVEDFFKNRIGIIENGHACESIASWMAGFKD